MPGTSSTTSTTRRIAHPSLVDSVTQELYRALFNGEMQPGSVVSIVELCNLFEVSHIPVREALRRLESEGLIELRPGRSAVVADLVLDDLDNVFHLLELVEGDLVSRAMATMTAENLARIESALTAPADQGVDVAARCATHRAFHRAFFADVAGDMDSRVLESLWNAADRYRHLLPEGAPVDADEHADLLRLARTGEVEELRHRWTSHLRGHASRLRDALA